MIVNLDMRRLRTIEHLRNFVEGNEDVEFQPEDRGQAYDIICETLECFVYRHLNKPDRGIVLRYLLTATGFSRPQLERLVRQWYRTGRVQDRRGGRRGKPFERKYTQADIRLLAQFDTAFAQMSGLATREALRREYVVHENLRFERLASISSSHIYNLRNSSTYRTQRTVWNHTRPTNNSIGLRQAPQPMGQPGHIRIDTVHQGDRDGVKGLYLINLVDEVTQFELIGAVQNISEHFLLPQLESLLRSFPFAILGFHADNGSEYINHNVAELLNKLHIGHFTKSRARRSNDNALVEGKNASVIRKWFGHDHIPQHFAPVVNRFAHNVLSPFLNYHRPCLFATEYRNDKGKVRRRYHARDVRTPYEKFRSLPNAEQYLKPGQSFVLLDANANAMSGFEAAQQLQKELRLLFQHLGNRQAEIQKAG